LSFFAVKLIITFSFTFFSSGCLVFFNFSIDLFYETLLFSSGITCLFSSGFTGGVFLSSDVFVQALLDHVIEVG